MTPPEALARTIEAFLVESPAAVVIEDGLVVFDLSTAKYSLSTEQNKCLLHLWSEDRNTVRRVDSVEHHKGELLLHVRKFGQAKPTRLEIVRDRDRRTPSAKKSARAAYQRFLAAVLQREFPGYKIERLSSAPDLEHSIGPAYARCMVRKGRSAFAAIGVNAQETQTTVDNILTAGLLWLERCRETTEKALTESLRIFVPEGRGDVVAVRLAHLSQKASRVHLYEVDEQDGTLREREVHDAGNIATRLVRCPNREAAEERFREAIVRVRRLVGDAGDVEIEVANPNEVTFAWRGLEFERARYRLEAGGFSPQQVITFGAGAYETPLKEDTEIFLRDLVMRMMEARRPNGDKRDALWRMQPERWLEQLVMRDIQVIDPRLDAATVYRQVPAFAATDRAMIDLLACTQDGRLAVIEIKASEDLHLPMQGLDYWARVNWHHQRGEFQEYGYFAGRQLSQEPPLLFLVAPALQIHPATDAQLKYLSPKIECAVIGVNEDWREGVRVIFRKSRKS